MSIENLAWNKKNKKKMIYILELNVQKLYNYMFKDDIVAVYLKLTTSLSSI